IRDLHVTGVRACALPVSARAALAAGARALPALAIPARGPPAGRRPPRRRPRPGPGWPGPAALGLPRPGRPAPRLVVLTPLGTFPADDLLPAGGLRGPAHRSRGRCLRQPGPVRPAAPPSRLRTRRRLHHGAVLRVAAGPGPSRRDHRGLRRP